MAKHRPACHSGTNSTAKPKDCAGRYVSQDSANCCTAGQEKAVEHIQKNRSNDTIRYDTIRDAILTCARKPTWVSLIYRTEPTTKKCKKNRKTKSRKQICSEITVNSPGNPCSGYLRRNEGLQWEGLAENEGFKPGVKEWVSVRGVRGLQSTNM